MATPFLSLLFAIIQTALVFYGQQVLQTATTQSARLVMTGQAQQQAMSQSAFKAAVCANSASLFNCTNLSVNIQTFASFTALTPLNPVQGGAINTAAMNFNPGNPGDIVLVQVFYPWPVVGPFGGFNLANMGSNTRLLIGTAVFRNEPY